MVETNRHILKVLDGARRTAPAAGADRGQFGRFRNVGPSARLSQAFACGSNAASPSRSRGNAALFGMPLSIVLVAVGSLLLAGFVKGFIGMGLPTIATGLLTLVMAPGQAAGLLVVPNFSTNAWQAFAGGRLRALVRRFWPMLVGICVGSTPGAGFLANDTSGRASMALGVMLVAYALMSMVSPRLSVPRHTEWWLAPVVGAVTGSRY
jgi:Sulfite exporter TauE/SafE